MTEDEAKTKWCPMVRVHYLNPIDILKNARAEAESRCIGSACMAWRWKLAPNASKKFLSMHGYTSDAPENGYCGLAGKP